MLVITRIRVTMALLPPSITLGEDYIMKKLVSLLLALVLVFAMSSVAMADDTTDLQDLFDNANGATVTLDKDYELSGAVWVDRDDITLDLKGHDISGADYLFVVDGYTLTVTDTSLDGDGVISASATGAYTICVYAGGVDLKSGAISAAPEGVAIALYDGSASVSGGKILGSEGEPVVAFDYATATITGGTFDVAPNPDYLTGAYKAVLLADGTYAVAEVEALPTTPVDNIIEIDTPGYYTWPFGTLPDGVTIKGVDGVVIVDGANVSGKDITIDNIDFSNPAGIGMVFALSGDSAIKNCDAVGNQGTYYCYAYGTLDIDNCLFHGTENYGLHIAEGDAEVTVSDSTLIGWNTYGSGLKMVFKNCTFLNNESGVGMLGFYGDASVTDSEFEEDVVIDDRSGATTEEDRITIDIKDCEVVDSEGNPSNVDIEDLLSGTAADSVVVTETPKPGPKRYEVGVAKTENGDVTVKGSASYDSGVVITATPHYGYEVGTVTVTKADGTKLDVTERADGTYSFSMPRGEVTIKVTFVPQGEAVKMVLTIGSKAVDVNGKAVASDVAPVIKASRTFLPVRLIAENLGAKVEWNNDAQTVTITKGDTVIVLTVGSTTVLVNGQPAELEAPVFIENSRTYLPVRFIAEKLGADVEWNGVLNTVTITGRK